MATFPSPFSSRRKNRDKAPELAPPSNSFPGSFQELYSRLTEIVESSDEGCRCLLETKKVAEEVKNDRTLLPRKSSKRRCIANQFPMRCNEMKPERSPTRKRGRASSVARAFTVTYRRESSSVGASPVKKRSFRAEQLNPRSNIKCHHLSPKPGTSARPSAPISSPTTAPSSAVRAFYDRSRSDSAPVTPLERKLMLVKTKRNGDPRDCYRLRNFSITSAGAFNLGDIFRLRGSGPTSSKCFSKLSLIKFYSSYENNFYSSSAAEPEYFVPVFKVAMVGAPGVGRTALTHHFTTSEFICIYDIPTDTERPERSIAVLFNARETELQIIDHRASFISVKKSCSIYNPDIFVIVYSFTDEFSKNVAERIVEHLWNNDHTSLRGIILVENKTDLERKRVVAESVGMKLAYTRGCKFIENSCSQPQLRRPSGRHPRSNSPQSSKGEK